MIRNDQKTMPTGVCIQLLTDRIQKADIAVPMATISVAAKCSFFPTLSMPNSITPRKPASRNKAVSTSYAMSGPARSEKSDQLVPN